MADAVTEKTVPAVQSAKPDAAGKGTRTRERLLDIAYESIVRKGFASTSIEELVEAPVTLVSTSPERDDTILVRDPFEG